MIFKGLDSISLEEIHCKIEGLGYVGHTTIYYRVPGVVMDVGMVELKKECDLTKMLEYAKENNYRIDLYVKHFFLEEGTGQTSNDIYSNVCPDEHASNDSHDVGYLIDEIDDYEWEDSDYSMGEDDDRLFEENVDEEAEWIGRIKQTLGLSEDGDDSVGVDSDEEVSKESDVDSLE